MEEHTGIFVSWDTIYANGWDEYYDGWEEDEEQTGCWIPDTDGNGVITDADFGEGNGDSELRPSQVHHGG